MKVKRIDVVYGVRRSIVNCSMDDDFRWNAGVPFDYFAGYCIDAPELIPAGSGKPPALSMDTLVEVVNLSARP